MRNKEQKAKELRRQDLLVKYQLVSDFVKSFSILYEKSPGLFVEVVDMLVVKKAIVDLNDLKELILTP